MDFLETVFLDNTFKSYLLVLATILVVLLFKKLLSHSIASLLYLLVHRMWKSIERKEFINLILKPLAWFIFITVSVFTIDKLNFPSAWNYKIYGNSLQEIFGKTGLCIIIISFIRLMQCLVDFIALILEQKAILTHDKADDQLIIFFRDFLKVILGIIGILLLVKAGFNQDLSNLLTGLSIVGAAIALSARESLENLIASFIIFFDKPFFVGDTLKVNNVTGTVERIGLRSTRIRTLDKTLVTVPNKQMVDSIVDNYSMRNQRRAEIKLELSEKTSVDTAQDFISSVKKILEEKGKDIHKFSVFLTEFSKNGLTVMIEYFTLPFTMAEFNGLKQEINIELIRLMEKHQIDMASAGSSINIFNSDTDAGAQKSRPII